MTLELYFVVMMKGGEVLFAVEGPFLEEEQAEKALHRSDAPRGRCYLKVASVKMECEVQA